VESATAPGEGMTDRVFGFNGEYRFLSNFWPSRVDEELPGYGVIIYPTVEHAYQAHKVTSPAKRVVISNLLSPAKAKKAGKTVDLRPYWEQVKLEVMWEWVMIKFTYHRDLRDKLLDTGDLERVEANTWGDTYWGTDMQGNGENHLGKILMQVRELLRNECNQKIKISSF